MLTKKGTFSVVCVDGVREFRDFGISRGCSLRSTIVAVIDIAVIIVGIWFEVFLLDLEEAFCCLSFGLNG